MFGKLKRRWTNSLTVILPLVSASILGDLGRILDKVFGICIVFLIVLLILVVAWILSHFMGGGSRG